jgi:hypothetical protein
MNRTSILRSSSTKPNYYVTWATAHLCIPTVVKLRRSWTVASRHRNSSAQTDWLTVWRSNRQTSSQTLLTAILNVQFVTNYGLRSAHIFFCIFCISSPRFIATNKRRVWLFRDGDVKSFQVTESFNLQIRSACIESACSLPCAQQPPNPFLTHNLTVNINIISHLHYKHHKCPLSPATCFELNIS